MDILRVKTHFEKYKCFWVPLAAGVISFFIVFFLMGLGNANWNYTFSPDGGVDMTLEQMGVRNMLETGTRNRSDRLGGPDGQVLYDYPVSDAFNYFIMWIISLFSANAAFVMNVFYVLTFPFAAMTAAYTLCKLKVSGRMSLFGGILFAFMAYHFVRNQNHFLLSAYYMVPLGILLSFRVLEGNLSFSFRKGGRNTFHRNSVFLGSVCIALVISSTGVYYAFFAAFFLLLALIKKFFEERKWSRSLTGGIVVMGCILFGGILNFIPLLIYRMQTDETAALSRALPSADIFGLKLLSLVLPNQFHRNEYLRHGAEIVNRSSPLTNENTTASLGLIGTFGLLSLFATPFLVSKKRESPKSELMKESSRFVLAGFILATIGGVGSVMCWTFFQGVRAYNRISVFLFFFCLLAVALIGDRLIFGEHQEIRGREKARSFWQRPKKWLSILLLPILFLGLYDQIPTIAVLDYKLSEARTIEKTQFFTAVEEAAGEGSLIFQLPYVAFPEPEDTRGLFPYSQIEPYLHTTTLRWSAGIMRGYSEDTWYRETANLEWDEMIEEIRTHSYEGVYIQVPPAPDELLQRQIDALIQEAGVNLIRNEQGDRLFFSFT